MDEILPSLILLEDSSGHRPEAEGGTAPRRRRRLDMRAKLPSTVMSEIDDWLRTNDWATVCNPPTLLPPLSILSFIASLPTCGPAKAAPASARPIFTIRKAALSRRSRELPTSMQATLALGKVSVNEVDIPFFG